MTRKGRLIKGQEKERQKLFFSRKIDIVFEELGIPLDSFANVLFKQMVFDVVMFLENVPSEDFGYCYESLKDKYRGVVNLVDDSLINVNFRDTKIFAENIEWMGCIDRAVAIGGEISSKVVEPLRISKEKKSLSRVLVNRGQL